MNRTTLILAAALVLSAGAIVVLVRSPGRVETPLVCTFNESEYLQLNPDVANAVALGQFASGQAHFSRFGQSERRAQALRCPGMNTRDRKDLNLAPCAFNETSYLAMNPEVAAAVTQGAEESGVAHYLRSGKGEGRRPNFECQPVAVRCAFNEREYLQLNPDVAQAVSRGAFATGAAHFARFGQTEGRAPAFDCPGNSTRSK